MALLKIKKYPDPILRKKCVEIKEIPENIKKLTEDMTETMIEYQGAGLSAPQVGESKRIIVVQIKRETLVFVNPKIIKKTKDTEIMEEGCLSFPGIWLKIKRAKGVAVEAIDKTGKKTQIKAEGLFARILQHEIDHLDGILFIDKVNFFQRLKIRTRLRREPRPSGEARLDKIKTT